MAPVSKRRKSAGQQSRAPRQLRTGPSAGEAARPASTASVMAVLPVEGGLVYPVAQRHPAREPWRLIMGLMMAAMAYLVLPSVIMLVVLRITFAVTGPGGDFQTYYANSAGIPAGLLASNLAIAAMAAVCFVLMRWINLAPPGLLWSVLRRLRWGYMAACGGAALAVFGVIQAISLGTSGTMLSPEPQFWWFLAVIVLTSPLQAAAEEVIYRGYLQQGVGSVTNRWWIGVLVSSVLFALAHGVQSPALFLDRLAFGVVAGLLVWRTGGLEAGIGPHIINNILAFVLAGLTGGVGLVRGLTNLSWDKAVIDVATFTLIGLLCWLLATKLARVRHTGPLGLGDKAKIG